MGGGHDIASTYGGGHRGRKDDGSPQRYAEELGKALERGERGSVPIYRKNSSGTRKVVVGHIDASAPIPENCHMEGNDVVLNETGGSQKGFVPLRDGYGGSNSTLRENLERMGM